ncbi:hypothetical protein [Sphingobium chlorophenolicum]|uniref:hypothetical protein n=1 Tax=Sphingobium chlorophenolicum TaxID=46429 RepID=UPI000788095E|nr:hypothetical protein [Sphingobium chlorophenolicum]
MRKFALIALVGALALSACGKKEQEAPVTNNLVEPPVENVIVEEPEAPAPEPSNNAAPAPAPAPTISEQQQIEDDAAATGMTSRLERAGADEGANATQ